MDPDPVPAPLPAPTVTTVGEGRATGTPDSLRLHVAVTFRSPSVSDALAGCASRLETVVGVARRFTDADKISSSGLSVDQWHENDGTVAGYNAQHSVSIVCADVGRAGDLVTALADAVGDGLRIGHVELFVSDTTQMRVQARDRAFADARAKGEELAALAGQRIDRATTVVEGGGGRRPYDGGAMAVAKVGTSFEPGTSTIEATVTVTWAASYR
jgi:uncharacterized protein